MCVKWPPVWSGRNYSQVAARIRGKKKRADTTRIPRAFHTTRMPRAFHDAIKVQHIMNLIAQTDGQRTRRADGTWFCSCSLFVCSSFTYFVRGFVYWLTFDGVWKTARFIVFPKSYTCKNIVPTSVGGRMGMPFLFENSIHILNFRKQGSLASWLKRRLR